MWGVFCVKGVSVFELEGSERICNLLPVGRHLDGKSFTPLSKRTAHTPPGPAHGNQQRTHTDTHTRLISQCTPDLATRRCRSEVFVLEHIGALRLSRSGPTRRCKAQNKTIQAFAASCSCTRGVELGQKLCFAPSRCGSIRSAARLSLTPRIAALGNQV